MRKYLLIIIALFLTNTTFAQVARENFNYEVRTAPLALLARWVTLDFSFNLINENWAVGPSTIIYAAPKVGNMLVPSYNGSAVGGHVYYYFSSFSKNSWYLGAHVYHEDYESYPHAFSGGHYDFAGMKYNPKVGYQALASTNISLLLGAGVDIRDYTQKNVDDSSGGLNAPNFKNYSSVIPYVEFKIGFKF